MFIRLFRSNKNTQYIFYKYSYNIRKLFRILPQEYGTQIKIYQTIHQNRF